MLHQQKPIGFIAKIDNRKSLPLAQTIGFTSNVRTCRNCKIATELIGICLDCARAEFALLQMIESLRALANGQE